MELLLSLLGLSVMGLWALWWLTYRALRRADHLARQREARIEAQLRVIEDLLERQADTAEGMPERSLRQEARAAVQQLLARH